MNIQGDSGRNFNILEGDSIGHFQKNGSYQHLSNSGSLPADGANVPFVTLCASPAHDVHLLQIKVYLPHTPKLFFPQPSATSSTQSWPMLLDIRKFCLIL
jgi:hypothetical protein